MKQEIIRKLSAAVAMSLVVGVSLAACGGGSSSTAAGVTKTGSAEGFGGAVTATLTVDANGSVTDCKLEGAQGDRRASAALHWKSCPSRSWPPTAPPSTALPVPR